MYFDPESEEVLTALVERLAGATLLLLVSIGRDIACPG